MALTSDPSVTYNSQGNITAAGTTLAANTTSSGATVDASSNALGTWLSVTVTFTTVAAVSGVVVAVYPAGDSTPHFDTTAMTTYTVPSAASSTHQVSVFLPTGKYSVTCQNTDATNGVTYGITSNIVS